MENTAQSLGFPGRETTFSGLLRASTVSIRKEIGKARRIVYPASCQRRYGRVQRIAQTMSNRKDLRRTRRGCAAAPLSALLKNANASAGLIFGLAFVPMMIAMGAAIDYTKAITTRSRLNYLADRAALAAVKAAAQKEADCVANPAGNNERNFQGCGRNDVIKAGVAAGVQYLMADPIFAGSNTQPDIQLANANGSWSATIVYSADVPTSISRIMGLQTIPVSGKVTSNIALGANAYLNFYLLLDRSMSMGIGATASDISRLQTLIGCAFGCHTSAYASYYYDLPKSQGIRFRIDDLRDATSALVSQAKLMTSSNAREHIRMGVYAFNHQVTPLVEMTDNLNSVATAVQTLDLPTVDDGTQAADALTWLSNNKVRGSGNGLTSSSPLEIVFLVTDGVEDGIYTNWWGMQGPKGRPLPWWPKWYTSAPTGSFPVGACDALKNKGAIVAVVYTTYVPFTGTVQYDNLIGPFAANIEPNLKSCASNGYFFTASQPGDITAGMQSLFNKALKEMALKLTR
jgi:Flp pilus assembly protein TadG